MDNARRPPVRSYRWEMTPDHELRDEDLEREIELVGALVLAAGDAEGRLPDEQIDELLGVHHDGDQATGAP